MSAPVATPRLPAMPALAPPLNPRPSTYIMSLPGVRLRASAAVMKTSRSLHSMGIERAPQRQEIAPGEALLRRLAQQVGGMKGGKQRDFLIADVEVEPLAAQFQDSIGASGKPLGRRGADAHQHLRSQDLDDAPQERQAHQGFLLGGRPVSGRPPEDDVGDEDGTRRILRLPGQSNRLEHP